MTLLNDNLEEQQFLKAELFRETGKFEESLSLIYNVKPSSEISNILHEKLIEKNLNQDIEVFEVIRE